MNVAPTISAQHRASPAQRLRRRRVITILPGLQPRTIRRFRDPIRDSSDHVDYLVSCLWRSGRHDTVSMAKVIGISEAKAEKALHRILDARQVVSTEVSR